MTSGNKSLYEPMLTKINVTNVYEVTRPQWVKSTGSVFCLLFRVRSVYDQPITGQVTEVTCPMIGRAQPELTPSKRQKTGLDLARRPKHFTKSIRNLTKATISQIIVCQSSHFFRQTIFILHEAVWLPYYAAFRMISNEIFFMFKALRLGDTQFV